MSAQPPHTETAALAAGQRRAAEYTEALREGVAWLRFRPGLEAEFQRSHLFRVRPQARFWQLFQVGVGILAANAIIGTARTDNDARLLLACLSLHLLVSAALAALSFSSAYLRWYLRIASILTPLRATAFAIIVANLIDTGGSGTAAMTINMFGLMFFSGLLLRQALPAAVVMVLAFPVALTAFGVAAPVATYSVSSLLVVFGLAGFVAWDTQRASRIAFLEHGVTRADATRDALTGLANRRHFDARLDSMWRAASVAGKPLTVLLIDVDHFKAYNDNYGHQAGDEALRAVAQALDAEAEKSAVVARFGGEEMALIAAGLAEHEAEALAGADPPRRGSARRAAPGRAAARHAHGQRRRHLRCAAAGPQHHRRPAARRPEPVRGQAPRAQPRRVP